MKGKNSVQKEAAMIISNYYPIFCISRLARRKGIVMATAVTEVMQTYYKCYLMCCTIS